MKDQGTRHLEDVWTRFLVNDAIEPDERAALSLAVFSDDVFRRRLLHDLRLDGALRAAARNESEGEAFVSRLLAAAARTNDRRREGESILGIPPADGPRRQRRKTVGFALAALAATVSAASWLLMMQGSQRDSGAAARAVVESVPLTAAPRPSSLPAAQPVASLKHPGVWIEEVEGVVTVYDLDGRVRPAKVSDPIAPEEWLTTLGPDSRVVVTARNGIEIELSADAVVTGLGVRPNARVFLARGSLRVAASRKAPRPSLEVASPHAIATGDACFGLEVSADETRVEVKRLTATVVSLRGGQSVTVTAEHVAIARANHVLAPVPIAKLPPRIDAE